MLLLHAEENSISTKFVCSSTLHRAFPILQLDLKISVNTEKRNLQPIGRKTHDRLVTHDECSAAAPSVGESANECDSVLLPDHWFTVSILNWLTGDTEKSRTHRRRIRGSVGYSFIRSAEAERR